MFTAIIAALAFQTPPYNLVIISGNGGIAITSYSSIWRCEKARDGLLELVAKENIDAAVRRSPGGSATPPARIELKAYCIPG